MPSHANKPHLERWLRYLPALGRRGSGTLPPSKVPQLAPQDASEPAPLPASPAPATILVTVLGLSGRALEDVLELVSREAKTKPIVPVFVTDSFDFAPFRRRRLRFEYLPDRERQQRFAPDLDWDLYLRRRYVLLGEKWRAQSVISFGRPPPRVPGGQPSGTDTLRINGP
jgi:hypothetical protein